MLWKHAAENTTPNPQGEGRVGEGCLDDSHLGRVLKESVHRKALRAIRRACARTRWEEGGGAFAEQQVGHYYLRVKFG